MKKSGRLVSLIVFFLLAVCIVWGRFLMPRWLTFDHLSILSWDVFGYYLYLPAQFIYHDIGITDFSWLQKILDQYAPTIGFYQAYMGPEGEYIMKYPMGMAILFAPFFFLAHLLAGPLGFPVDGFSLPYQISIALGCVLYAIIGIWFLRKILLRYFSGTVTTIVLILLVLGTNYFQLTAYDSAMVHNSLFTIYTIIIWFTIQWHDHPKWRYAIPIGLFVGLAALIRPTEIISALIPVLWGIYNRDSWKKKWSLVTGHWSQVTGMVLMVFLVGSFQLIYWKVHAGTFIYYSYEEGEQLRFLAPYLPDVLFSWKKGWLIYTPMMVFPLAGFIFLFKRKREIFWATFLFFAVNLLIISSWTTWWYGGSLGQRSLMQSYAIMALPFGAFIAWMMKRRWWWQAPFVGIAIFFIWMNLFQTWQYMSWIIDPSRMTKEYYWAIFGRKSVPASAHKYLEWVENFDREFLDEYDKYEKRILAFYNFEHDKTNHDPHLTKDTAKSGTYALRMDSLMEFSPGIKMTYREVAPKEGSWLRAQLFLFPLSEMRTTPANLVITMESRNGNYKYKSIALEEDSLAPGRWNEVTMDYEIPYVRDPEDVIAVYIWNRGKGTFYIDDLQIELLEPR
ncbi:MAG: glycosyltransferase family 39 protein [Bacteroidales bacterium]|nr:glycosyltransferase family 39 protein [Bacteroidales bacterium]